MDQESGEREEDNRIIENLRMTLAKIHTIPSREKMSKDRVKFRAQDQYNRINQLLMNAEQRGNWEYDIKRFVSSCDKRTQEKLSGNYLDIRVMKANMRRSEHVHLLKEDWQYIAILLAIDSLRNSECLTLEECLDLVTRDRGDSGKYNWTENDSKRLMIGEVKIDKAKPQKRKRGNKSQTRTVKALSETLEENIELKVKGRNMRTTTLSNVKRLKISCNTIWRKHIQSKLTRTVAVEIDPQIGLFKFTKIPTEALKNKMKDMLQIDKDEARRQIKEKRSRDKDRQKELSDEELKHKRMVMKRSTCWKKCMYCQYLDIDTIILESSSRAHYRLYHQKMNSGGMEPLALPVVQILEKE